jgi:hypothetical protein
LNGRHVVFGKIVSGLEVLKVMEMVATDNQDRPRTAVVVTDCGQIGVSVEEEAGNESENVRNSTANINEEGDEDRKDEASEEYEETAEQSSNKVEDDEFDESKIEEKMSTMTEMEKRLFKLRMRMNQGRKANKAEVENEYKRFSDPKYEQKQKYQVISTRNALILTANALILTAFELILISCIYQENLERKKNWNSELQSRGLSSKDSFMLQTAEAAMKKQERLDEKEKHKYVLALE